MAEASPSALRASLAGRFDLGALAGKGGMGEVYAGVAADGSPVAIKRVSLGLVADLSRFVREAEVLEQLSHPNIVRYVEHGVTDGGHHYLVTEWIDGASLADRLRAGGPLAIDDVIALARGVAGALGAAHAAGLIHRDLKPSNLMLPGGRAADVKLIDFGIARAIGDGGGGTTTGEIIGTPGFCAPEQARGERQLDGRADLFGLGAILYEALTGVAAFAADDIMTTLALVLMHDPVPIASLRRDAPGRLVGLVNRLLAKDPAARPQTAGALSAELDDLAAAIAAGDTAALAPAVDDRPTVDERRAGPTAQPQPQRLWIAAAAAAAAIAAAIAIGLALSAGDDAPAGAGATTASGPACDEYDLTGCDARCTANDGAACFVLGNAVVTGTHGVAQDRPAGLDLLRRSCDLGELRACVVAARQLQLAGQAGELPDGWEREYVTRLDGACTRGLAAACRALGTAMITHQLRNKMGNGRALLERGCKLGDRASCIMLRGDSVDADSVDADAGNQ